MTHFARVASSALAASRTLSTCRCRVVSSVGQTRLYQTPASEEIPIIRVPRSLQVQVENVKQARGKHKVPTIRAGKLLIQSRNPKLNQSAGYLQKKFEELPLCSKGWKHNKSFGDYFTINNTRSVAPCVTNTAGDHQEPAVTFNNLRICKELQEVLKSVNITHPTTVQLNTIPKVMRGHNVLCAAETGSGKTLTYLLPAVNRILADRVAQVQAGSKISTLVLVPSRELAEQVLAVSRTLCGPLGLQTRSVGGGRGVGHIMEVFKRDPPDVLVATPGALVKALRRRCLDLGDLRYFVVDEADTMFDPSFSEMLEKILGYANIARNPDETKGMSGKAQLLVVGATFPGGVGEVLDQVTDLGSMVVIKSRMLHFLMPHVKQTFLKVRGEDKVLELNQALKQLQKDKGEGGVLVFCNKSSTVNWVGYSLDELKVKHARLQGEMPAAMRAGIFRTFQNGAVDVLICTDIASRGLDTSKVRLVVNYDFPESHTDYIHRAGRVGRAGGVEDGEVLSMVTHPWNVELVQKIESAARRKTSLPGMESEIHKPKAEGAEPEEDLGFNTPTSGY